MAFGDIEIKRTDNTNKIIAGSALAIVAAVGLAAAHPKSRRAIKNALENISSDTAGKSDSLAAWLKDAYAMEEAQLKVLKGIMDDFRDHEEIYETIGQHLAQTEKQKNDVKKCLEAIGEKPSKAKQMMGVLAGIAPAVEMKMFEDKKVKDILSMITAERFEEASYEALAIAAEAEGRKAIANTMKRIAREEREMALWLEEQVPRIILEEMPVADG